MRLCQRRTTAALLVVMCLFAMAGTARTQIPQKLNYQVMLTDDVDQPLADQNVEMVFSIWDEGVSVVPLWTETQNVATNSIGVVSVILGSVNPIDIDFDVPLWLEVEVDGEVLSPRREIVGAPYALTDEAGGAGDGHSLDADDGTPTDAVYVDGNGYVGIGTATPNWHLDVKGNVQVGGTNEAASLMVGGETVNNAAVGLKSVADRGGIITLCDGTGLLKADLGTSMGMDGGAYLILYRDNALAWGFNLDGDGEGTGEPLMEITGTSREVVFDMDASGDESVQLPGSSVSRSEVRDEPGAASRQTSDWIELPLSSVTSVASRQIVVPDDGYVFAMGTAQVEFENSVTQRHYAVFGISETYGAFSDHAQITAVEIPSGMPGSWHNQHISVQGLFAVSAGASNFYFNALESDGICSVRGRHLTLMYFPTSYGTVDTNPDRPVTEPGRANARR
ncbi:MAG: hypothetical protein V3T20_02690 [Gemmatimonadota bacterium]